LSLLAKVEQEVLAFDEAADVMLLLKDSRIKRRQMLKDVDEAMRHYALSAVRLDQNGSKSMEVEVLTHYGEREKIAKFMKRLSDEGYASVGTREIKLNEDLYQSRVRIVR
jgi:hypothetical protein